MKNLIICGAPKCATTSLFRYLAGHPQVCPSYKKELNYFLVESESPEDYMKCFKSCEGSSWFLEASPAYTRQAEEVAPRIREVLPDAKLIFVFREPVARLYSYFCMEAVNFNRVKPGIAFDDYVKAILGNANAPKVAEDPDIERFILDGAKVGFYASLLRQFLTCFERDNIYVMFVDELKHSPQQALRGVCDFVGIDPGYYESFNFSSENKAINPRHAGLYRAALRINSFFEPVLNYTPALRGGLRKVHHLINSGRRGKPPYSESTREALKLFYDPPNRELFDLLEDWPSKGAVPNWLLPGKKS